MKDEHGGQGRRVRVAFLVEGTPRAKALGTRKWRADR